MGGLSAEREVSLRSGRAMAGGLTRKGYRVTTIDVGRDLPGVLVTQGIETAVIALHGPLGEDGTVQGMLEVMGIPYTGSGVAASANCMDKGLAKRLFRHAGLPTPDWNEIRVDRKSGQVLDQVTLPPPVFVKPLGSGSSVGVVAVQAAGDMARAIAEAASAPDGGSTPTVRVLVERAVVGRELTVGILGEEILPLIEIRPRSGFFDHTNKYTAGRTEYLIPPPNLDDGTAQRVREAALGAYRAAGCSGLARVDVMLDEQGNPWILEINTLPGMTELSLVPQAARAAGIGFDTLVERILEGAGLTL